MFIMGLTAKSLLTKLSVLFCVCALACTREFVSVHVCGFLPPVTPRVKLINMNPVTLTFGIGLHLFLTTGY